VSECREAAPALASKLKMPETAPPNGPHLKHSRKRRFASQRGRRFTTSPEYLRSSCRCAGEIQTETIVEKGVVAMSRLVKVIRSHHEISRTRRELNRAISNAATPSMRDELILVAQRAGNVL
jgi:hypothetical protein